MTLTLLSIAFNLRFHLRYMDTQTHIKSWCTSDGYMYMYDGDMNSAMQTIQGAQVRMPAGAEYDIGTFHVFYLLILSANYKHFHALKCSARNQMVS